MSLVSPSVQSVQAFVFGLDNDTESRQQAIPPDLVDDAVGLGMLNSSMVHNPFYPMPRLVAALTD